MIKSNFQPYADNGGTVVGISGPDYCVLAADSRLSDKYMIHSRDFSRLYPVRPYKSICEMIFVIFIFI